MDLQKKMDQLNQKWNKSNKTDGYKRLYLGDSTKQFSLISTNNPALDKSLGGGIPQGNIVELFGVGGCGKTTQANYIMSSILDNKDKFAVYCSLEDPAPPEKAWSLAGITEEKRRNIIFIPAIKSGEDVLNLIRDIVIDENGLVNKDFGCLIIDSVSAFASENELTSIDNNGFEGNTVATQARLVSKWFRTLCGNGWLSEGAIVVLINQQRTQISTVPLPDITSGGKSVTYYPKIRVKLSKPKAGHIEDEYKNLVGHTVEYEVIKNNTGYGTVGAKGNWKVIYNQGIDTLSSIIETALELSIIQQVAKAVYVIRLDKYTTEPRIRGRANLEKYINEKNLADSINQMNTKVLSIMNEHSLHSYDGIILDENHNQVEIFDYFIIEEPEEQVYVEDI